MKSKVTAFQKRLFTEIFVLGFALALIFGLFTLVRYLQSVVEGMKNEGKINSMQENFLSQSVNFFNGAAIYALNRMYQKLTTWVVSWENHEFQSAQDNALVLKNFIFQCTNSYLYILYQIFFLPDLQTDRLRNNIIITFISNFFSKSILVNFINKELPGALPDLPMAKEEAPVQVARV
jgi:hypothetical protein